MKIDTSKWQSDDWLLFFMLGLPAAVFSVAGAIALVIYAAMGRL